MYFETWSISYEKNDSIFKCSFGKMIAQMYLPKCQPIQTLTKRFARKMEIATKWMTVVKYSFNKYNGYYLFHYLLKATTRTLFKSAF